MSKKILKKALLALIIYHLFILQNQKDLIYIVVAGIYMLTKLPISKNIKTIYRDLLICIVAGGITFLLGMSIISEITMDYVYILLVLGLISETLVLVLPRGVTANPHEITHSS